MPTHRRLIRRASVTTALSLAAFSLTVAGGPAYAVSADITVSQVYGGGGNTGAPFNHDFVELYNRGTATVTVTGWTVQYASATGSTWSKTALSGSITPGHHYLVQESGGTTGAALPTPDATGTIAMSATAGKVALVTNSTALACSTGCATAAGVRDFVGYGTTASSAEGSPTGNLSNTTAALRGGGGATDTDHNSTDFTIGAPAPRNSSAGVRIHDIQGRAHISPLNGQAVTGVPGVVTAVTSNGFFMQDPAPDADPATSEGIFVFTSTAPGRHTGDSVTVSGTVAEFRSGGSTSANLTTTEIDSPTVTLVATGVALPPATLVGTGGRVPPATVIDSGTTGNAETSGTFDPTAHGLDFWESLEDMRVQLNNAAVVGPSTSGGEFAVVPAGSTVRSARGGIVGQQTDMNPERVFINNALAVTPTVNVGDTLTGATVGVLTYNNDNYQLDVTTTPAVTSGGITQETTTAAGAGQLAVATFNVENLAPTDPATKFRALATIVVGNLKAPDLIAVEEVQDNSGATDNGVVACDQTMAKLIAAITAAGGPTYQFREIDPVNDQDGGQPGGNIRQVFLFRTDRGLAFVDRPGGTSTAADSVVTIAGKPALNFSPGRVDPANSAWNASRKPLAGQFTFDGHTVFMIANHFDAKLGDDPLTGRFQPPSTPSATQRVAQATEVHTFVNQILAVDPSADVVVLGDLNDFEYSTAVTTLTGGGSLTDLPATLPVAERYTYVFEGNSEVLDHILLSASLAATSYSYDVVHVNSEFANQISDHEPQVVRLPLP
ncbi:MAG TPA: lamin tail domain-containing protein [Micromonosporaceae bacterium]|nr:lamin tail domain-containing protein [Micromonosporaceae bacterium]